MTIAVFIVITTIIFFVDIKDLKSKGQKKDMYYYVAFMIVAFALGLLCLPNIHLKSLAGFILQIFNVKV